MTPKSNTVILLFFTLVFYLLIKVIISYTALSSFAVVAADAEFDSDTQLEFFYSTGSGFQPDKSYRSKRFPAGKRMSQKIYLKNNVVRSLRMDIGSGEGVGRIYELRLASFFGDTVVFDAKGIYEKFKPNTDIESYELREDYLLISSNGPDPFLVSTETLQADNLFLQHIFPVLLTFLFWVFVSSFSLRSFPPVQDLRRKKSSMGINIDSIDGIRGMAALMVLVEHAGLMNGIGALGVWLFFALSGFLLVTPFVHDPAKAYSFSYMRTFLLRRLKRIIPMYYTLIIVIMLFRMKNPEIFRHLLFLQADAHLWTVPQEMFFYLLLPFVMVLCCIQIPWQRLYCFVLLAAMIWSANTYLTPKVVSLYGSGNYIRPLVGIFLSGVLFSYIHYWFHTNQLLQRLARSLTRHGFSILGIVLLVALVATSPLKMKDITHFDANNHFGIVGFLCAVFIFLTVMSKDALLGKIASFPPLRAVGIVGFSFYLLHPTLIWFSQAVSQYYFNMKLEGVEIIIVGGITTYLLSMLTYTYIERPFLISKK
ncbi:MAG: acyltransferase [Thermodesulfobacteriota bacterium]